MRDTEVVSRLLVKDWALWQGSEARNPEKLIPIFSPYVKVRTLKRYDEEKIV